MAIVVTYVCDVTGKSGVDEHDFVRVYITATEKFLSGGYQHSKIVKLDKLVHRDVAHKLNLIEPNCNDVAQPEVTFEGKLKALLEDHVQELVEGHLENFRGS